MKIRAVVKGATTFIPGIERILPKAGPGNNLPSSYFYGVWLKHIAFLSENELYGPPKCIAELGPGNTLGIGIMGLLTGADRYYGLDVVAHTTRTSNLTVLDELIEILNNRTPRPRKGWPDFDHMLDEHHFPSRILKEEQLAKALEPERLKRIRQALTSPAGQAEEVVIDYRVPWNEASVIEKNSVDLIMSHAVLEHISDIRGTYAAMYRWLKPGGVISHQIDFRSHNLTKEWNGHRAISEPLWKIIMGNRPYLINREPWSVHRSAITACGFEMVSAMGRYRSDGIPRSRHSKRWRNLSDEDITCEAVFFQARKPVDKQHYHEEPQKQKLWPQF